MSKVYQTRPKHVQILHRPTPVSGQLDPNPPMLAPAKPVQQTIWSPVNRNLTESDNESDNESLHISTALNPINISISETEVEEDNEFNDIRSEPE